jgi:hypothetical protein
MNAAILCRFPDWAEPLRWSRIGKWLCIGTADTEVRPPAAGDTEFLHPAMVDTGFRPPAAGIARGEP